MHLQSLIIALRQGDTLPLTVLSLLALTGALIIIVAVQAARLQKISARLNAMMRGATGMNIEEMLANVAGSVELSGRRMEGLEQAVGVLQAQIPGCLQRVGMVRYDAFDDVGGEQSFSLALLDRESNGVILTSVYSRMDVRVYAKAIRGGKPSHSLSDEELRALRESVEL